MKPIPVVSCLSLPFACFLFASFALLDPSATQAQTGRVDTLAQTGTAAPDGNGNFGSFRTASINDWGEAAFSASLYGTTFGENDNTGIFSGSGESITQIVRERQLTPGGIDRFDDLIASEVSRLDASGTALFSSQIAWPSNDFGLFRGDGGAITQIVRTNQEAPDGSGTFISLSSLASNDSGEAAFEAEIMDADLNVEDAIFRDSGGDFMQIARQGQAAPDGNGTYINFRRPDFNNSNAAAFRATLIGTSVTERQGIFRGSGGPITQIARGGQMAPDGIGSFSSFGNAPSLNVFGAAAFVGALTGTAGGTNDDVGIFRGNGGIITQVAREGQAVPDGNGSLSEFGDPILNRASATAFWAILDGTSGGNDDDAGIFRDNGGALTLIAREGQTVPDGNGSFSANFYGPFRAPLFIDSGAVAFSGRLTGTSGGTGVDDVGLYVGDGIDFFEFARRGMSVNGSLVLDVSLHFDRGMNRHGQIAYVAVLANGDQRVQRFTPDLHWRTTTSGGWDNTGRWTLGLKPAPVHDVYVDPDVSLTVGGPGDNTIVRSLQIGGGIGAVTLNLIDDAIVTAANGVTIHPAATLTGEGTIAGNVNNQGTLIADSVILQGDLGNTGMVQLGLGSSATFHGAMTQNGTMQVPGNGSTHSTATVMGTFSGSGGFEGGGNLLVFGDVRPGNSAGSVLYDGNLTLGSSTNSFIEIGGLGTGQFDQFQVTGDLSLAGDLLVSFIDGHSLGINESYLIGDVDGSLMGQFNGLDEGDPIGNFDGIDLFITYAAGNGNDVALYSAESCCDFDGDGKSTIADLNSLLAEGPISGGVPVTPGINDQFDLTGDESIGPADLDQWLANAATENGLAAPYFRGDANLDGIVDVSDFNSWNANNSSASLRWDAGNFNGDGAVDSFDFSQWHANQFKSSSDALSVPEPPGSLLSLITLLFVVASWKRTPRQRGDTHRNGRSASSNRSSYFNFACERTVFRIRE